MSARAAERYAHAAPPRKPQRGGRREAFVSFSAIAAVLLCVALLLMRARVTAVRHECENLDGSIAELSDEHARLTIEYESMYTLEEIEEYASGVLGMVPGN